MYGLTSTDNPFDFTQFINLLGLFGNIFAIILFISPFLLIIKLHKREIDPQQFPYLIMMMNVMNCFLWLSYGILIEDFFIKLANGIGYPINMIYLCLFFFYRSDRSFGRSLFFILPSIIISAGLFYLLAYVIQNTDLTKFSAMIFNIFMYAAPGQNIVIISVYLLASYCLFNKIEFQSRKIYLCSLRFIKFDLDSSSKNRKFYSYTVA